MVLSVDRHFQQLQLYHDFKTYWGKNVLKFLTNWPVKHLMWVYGLSLMSVVLGMWSESTTITTRPSRPMIFIWIKWIDFILHIYQQFTHFSFDPVGYCQHQYWTSSVCVTSHYDVIDKNNNVNCESLDIHYHSSSHQTLCYTSDNVCLDLSAAIILY